MNGQSESTASRAVARCGSTSVAGADGARRGLPRRGAAVAALVLAVAGCGGVSSEGLGLDDEAPQSTRDASGGASTSPDELAGEGGNAVGASGGEGGASGAPGGGNGGAAGSDAGGACSRFADEPGEAELHVVIENARATPIYLVAERCVPSEYAYLSFARRGEALSVEAPMFGFPCVACAEGASDACDASCANQPPLHLEPGARYELGPLRSEIVAEQVTPGCGPQASPGVLVEGLSCYRQVPLARATYRVRARALSELCSSGSGDCSPDASGVCLAPSLCVALDNGGFDLEARAEFAFPAQPNVVLRFE